MWSLYLLTPGRCGLVQRARLWAITCTARPGTVWRLKRLRGEIPVQSRRSYLRSPVSHYSESRNNVMRRWSASIGEKGISPSRSVMKAQ